MPHALGTQIISQLRTGHTRTATSDMKLLSGFCPRLAPCQGPMSYYRLASELGVVVIVPS